MAKQQLPLFGFKEDLPSAKIKKMVSPARVAEVLAARNGTDEQKIKAMRNFGEDLEKYLRRIKV